MKFKIKRVGNGIQEINRLNIICDNGKTSHIDIWDDELLILEDYIREYIKINTLNLNQNVRE